MIHHVLKPFDRVHDNWLLHEVESKEAQELEHDSAVVGGGVDVGIDEVDNDEYTHTHFDREDNQSSEQDVTVPDSSCVSKVLKLDIGFKLGLSLSFKGFFKVVFR